MSKIKYIGFHKISFGKYKNKPLDKIPLTYLDWLIDQKWLSPKYPKDSKMIEKYLAIPSIKRELEIELTDNEFGDIE